jgi:hypothetical protein
MIENKLKTDKEKGKLGEEKYQIVVFALLASLSSLAWIWYQALKLLSSPMVRSANMFFFFSFLFQFIVILNFL